MTVLKKLAGIILLITALQINLSAQEINDAINAFNQGVGMIKADDAQGAIPFMENCVTICEQLGDTASDLKYKAISQIPNLYYKVALKNYTQDKNMPVCVKSCKAAINVSEKYSSAETKEKALDLMSKAYFTMGAGFVSTNENDKAINAFDSALIINPDYTKAIMNKALVYKKMNNSAKFGETIDLYITKVKASGDTVQVAQANKLAVEYYRSVGVKANQANKPNDAVTSLKTALKYGNEKDVYYQLANVYNKQKNYIEAMANAQKGLELETGTPEAKAKFYYELAVAQAGKLDNGNACENFKNANYPPFVDAVKAQRINLKCK
jgi:tetratricopeptide (TPR) repeat protein